MTTTETTRTAEVPHTCILSVKVFYKHGTSKPEKDAIAGAVCVLFQQALRKGETYGVIFDHTNIRPRDKDDATLADPELAMVLKMAGELKKEKLFAFTKGDALTMLETALMEPMQEMLNGIRHLLSPITTGQFKLTLHNGENKEREWTSFTTHPQNGVEPLGTNRSKLQLQRRTG